MSEAGYASELVQEQLKRIKSHRPRKGVSPSVFRALAEWMVKRAGEHYLLEHADGSWLLHAEALTAGIRRRREGEILVRVEMAPRVGSQGPGSTIISTCMPDQPFIVDSMRLCFEQNGVEIRSQANMIVPLERTKEGILKRVGSDDSDLPLESITHFEVSPIPDAAQRKALSKELSTRLVQARAVAGDFRRMLRHVKDLVNQYEFLASVAADQREEIQEARAFLEWVSDDNLVFMGLSHIPKGADADTRLGLHRLRRDPLGHTVPETKAFLADSSTDSPYVVIRKTRENSTLHRSGRMDEVVVRQFNDRGEMVGSTVIHGLFTYRAISARGGQVPLLRTKLRQVLELEEVRRGTYNYKSIVNAFNALPVEYLFGAPVPDIRQLISRSLAAERSRRLEVHLSLSEGKRSAYLFVVMPRENFNENLRARIQDLMEEELGSNYCDGRVEVSNYGVAVLHYYFTGPSRLKSVDHSMVERAVIALAASWQDRFREALMGRLDRTEALEVYRLYHNAFSQRYQVSTEPEQVVTDCLHLESVRADGGLRFGLYTDGEDAKQHTIKLRIYEDKNLWLSDILPILDNFGLSVVNSFTNHVEVPTGEVLYMDTFRFQPEEGAGLDDDDSRHRFLDALAAVFDGRMANDRLNRVLLPAGLTWRQVDLLRSLQAYARQIGGSMAISSTSEVLQKHAGIVRDIVAYFEDRFGPGANGKVPTKPSTARIRAARRRHDQILHSIDRVESFMEDRLLRVFLNLVESMLRTTYFRTDRPHPSIAHKFDCSAITSMSDPRPWREIHVHHAELEGVHLRGGPIARGGLRWSDRPDDYRTEILGLMTTQMVKNVVIVPAGAKGGFVLRRPPADPRQRRVYADAMYEIFIHALLDLTDNVSGTRTIAPRHVVCYDDPDPYLVVAADKGTAHLSDTANRISAEREFWLGDAFASGGSHGYDHKAIGITARGAWVCMRHLLREQGIHPENQTFTVVGIGDMGGDVFGNGMIEHDTIRLLAAFNHLHIFLDPDPDPKVSAKERKRLFTAKAGGWDAYNPKRISKGGGVFERSAKSIPLSVPVRRMLGTEATSMSGNELVHHILQMEVDVLYNGGIGTYVKASTETQAAAADPGNDAVRIDADQLRARVVGEGGNLGLTQAARIQFAAAGGRINTDFIDNAGGVNISDHEVNLKILFGLLVDSGKMKLAARNRLLKRIEPDVVADVLDANADQALLLSLDEQRSRRNLAPFDGLIDEVCRRFGVKRGALSMPTVREITRRMEAGQGLTRPELATLSSYVKMMLYQDLVEDPRIDLAGIRPAVLNYFPASVRKRYTAAIDRHRLGREIALTRLTNRIVDHTGITFFSEMAVDCDAHARLTFEAYSLLSRAADAWVFKDAILRLGYEVPVDTKYEAFLTVEASLREGTKYLLENWTEKQISDALRRTGPYSRKLLELAKGYEERLDPDSSATATELQERFHGHGIPKGMARQVGGFRFLPDALAVLDLAHSTRRPAKRLARDYFELGSASGIFRILRRLDGLQTTDYHDALALRSLRRETLEILRRLVVKLQPVKGDAATKLDTLGQAGQAYADLDHLSQEQLGPSALLVASERFRTALR